MQEVNVEKLERLQKQLQRKFDLVYPLDDEKSFFIGVADYVQAIEQSDYLTAIIKSSILPDRIKLDSEINTITKKSTEETKEVFEKLRKLIADKKIDNPAILAEVQEYDYLLSGKTTIFGDSGNSATHLSDKVRDILIAFKYNGYDDIAKEYEILDEHGNNRGWKISPSEAEVEKKLLERKDKNETSLWGAWNDLWWAFGTIHERHDIWDTMVKGKDTHGYWNFSGLIGEWKKILKDELQPQDRRTFFKKDLFKSHFARIHDKIDNEIDSLIDAAEQAKANEQSKFRYDAEGAMLFYDEKLLVKFHRSSGRAQMFEMLWNGKRVEIEGKTIEQGKPAILRKDLASVATDGYKTGDDIDKAIKFFRNKLKGLPAEIVAEKGFRLIITG